LKLSVFRAQSDRDRKRSSALDVLRHANDYAGVRRYRYRTYTENGGTVRASNGLEIQAGTVIAKAADPALLFVCAGSAGGSEPLRGESPETRKWLRHLSRNNTPLGSAIRSSSSTVTALPVQAVPQPLT